ncbi:MAG: diguanylate cyclase [Burkholderiaceae bacterium]
MNALLLPSHRFAALVLALIPPSCRDDRLTKLRAHNLVVSLLLSAVLVPAYGLFYAVAGDPTCGWSCLAAMAPILLSMLLLRVGGRLAAARELLLAALFTLILFLTYRLGGIAAPSATWLVVCAVIGMVSGSIRTGLLWSALSVAGLTLMYVLGVAGVPFPAPRIDDMPRLYALSAISLAMTISVYLVILETSIARFARKWSDAVVVIRDMAIRDELTGVCNRREILRLAELEREHAQRKTPAAALCVCLIDLDYFKSVNDRFGHGVGDAVLRAFAAAMQDGIRKTDHFGRYGGEEFLLVLPGVDGPRAGLLAEKLRQRIAQLAFPEMPGLSVTISIGIAQFADGESLPRTIFRADRALYEAKDGGRDQVVVAA